MKKWAVDSASSHTTLRRTAIHLLSRREYSHHTLREKLLQKGHSTSACEAVLQQLTEEGLLNDERFAEAYIHAKKNQGQGPLRIQAGLKQAGIPDFIIAKNLNIQDNDWLELAKKLITRRLQRQAEEGQPRRDPAIRAKWARFLAYRGWLASQIHEALNDNEI